MKPFSFLLLASSFFFSSFHNPGQVELYFRNCSNENLKELLVNIRGKEFFFHNLKKGDSTKAVNVESTYKYCYGRVVTARDTLICQPIDFVGEKLITEGKVVMEVKIDSTEGHRYLAVRVLE